MNVSCPQCKTVFRVDPRKVPAEGVRARCSVCGGVFEVLAEEKLAPAAAPPTPRPVAPPPPPPPPPPPAAEPAWPTTPPIMPPPVPEPIAEEPEGEVPDADGAPAVDAGFAPPPELEEPTPATEAVEPETPEPVGQPAPVTPPPVEPPQPPPVWPTPPPVEPPQPPPVRPTPAPVAGFQFGQADLNARARRLARALISDLAAYYPDRQEKGLREGRLKELFQEELRKSWQEYVDQVGLEVAKSTPHFRDALNEILARGKRVF